MVAMHFDRLLQDQIDLLEESTTGRDARHDPVIEWVPFARNVRCSVEQLFTDERLSRRDVVHVRYTVFLHASQKWTLNGHHRIRWPAGNDGKIYRIEGEPEYSEDSLEHFEHIEFFMELFD